MYKKAEVFFLTLNPTAKYVMPSRMFDQIPMSLTWKENGVKLLSLGSSINVVIYGQPFSRNFKNDVSSKLQYTETWLYQILG